MDLEMEMVGKSWLRVLEEVLTHCSLHQERSEMGLCQLVHVLWMAGFRVWGGVRSRGSHQSVTRGCFRGEGWNCRWLEAPRH
jgi:hypothetical protein